MIEINFTIDGNPKGLKRHRTVRCGKFSRNYDPSAPDKADLLAKCMQHKPDTPITGRIILKVMCYFARPKSHYNSKGILKETSPEAHTSRPDADNCAKMICDALNGIYWKDDSQIYSLSIIKLYDMCPRTLVNIVGL